MKYIITEDQQNKLIDIILRYLDSNLVPQGGWKDKKYYQKEMEQNYEMFFMFNTEEEDFGWGESDHMYYTQCDNPNSSLEYSKFPNNQMFQVLLRIMRVKQ